MKGSYSISRSEIITIGKMPVERSGASKTAAELPVSNAFVDKLRNHTLLTDEDTRLLTAACAHQRTVPARHDLVREGDPPGPVFVMLEGWACQYKLLPEGGRQITAFLMPGDFCDIHVAVLDHMDHSLATLTESRVAMIPRAQMEELTNTRPAIMRAFWRIQLVDEGVLRAWIVSMGRRSSIQRVAHLLCELCVRAHSIGHAGDHRCELPISQIAFADAVGLTPVHVNRVLRKLRLLGVIEKHARCLIVTDITELGLIAGFDKAYLQQRLRRHE